MSKILIVISGPSAVGKKCIMEGVELYCKLKLINTDYNKIKLYNTREIRTGEKDGVDYNYSYDDFIKKGKKSIKANKTEVKKYNIPKYLKQDKIIESGSVKGLFMYPVRKIDLQGIFLDDIKNGVSKGYTKWCSP